MVLHLQAAVLVVLTAPAAGCRVRTTVFLEL